MITPSTCWETRTEDKRIRTKYKRLGIEEAKELGFTVGLPVKTQSQKFVFRLKAVNEIESKYLGEKRK